ncbi:Di-copper centre-containing protein [Dendrothele bispora CBS 962.96]|uniref:Di-copper centre-containing protein n=1 Tax=Dendrothele bispora (strain CBS 962.96) TaxID=1314807 RepID=A0A4S8LAP1_DENBC|nr:Di-copper centre-containing protein [Dendrothele bispora CBS 962.96]
MFSRKLVSAFFAAVSFCVGVKASCTNPAVRREWRTLSTEERADWIAAVNCLAKLPHDEALTPFVKPSGIVGVNSSSSYYDDIVYIHMDLNTIIHFTGMFFPFHRYYVQKYEDALRSQCGFNGVSPYWNWAQDAADVYNSPLFTIDRNSSSGLGGWGDPSNDFQVPTGGFSDFHLSYPSPHIVRRNFTLQPWIDETDPGLFPTPATDANATFTQDEVDYMVNNFVGDFVGFQKYMEGFEGPHGAVHFIVGGDLGGKCPASFGSDDCGGGPTFSANEPIFWLHHAMVDKVWYDWQHANEANGNMFEGGSVQQIDNATIYNEYPTGSAPYLTLNSTIHGDGIFENAVVSDVISTTDGILCYIYE